MKKILLAAGAILIPAMAIFAQEYTRSYAEQANPSLKNQFTADFPDAKNVHFARLKDLNEVTFSQGTEKVTAYYRDEDQLFGTIRKGSFDGLPGNAQKEIQQKYPGYNVVNVVKFDDNESELTELIVDGMSMDDADNYYVELKNDNKAIVVKVDLSGGVNYLTAMK
jgi:hypothetical protein